MELSLLNYGTPSEMPSDGASVHRSLYTIAVNETWYIDRQEEALKKHSLKNQRNTSWEKEYMAMGAPERL